MGDAVRKRRWGRLIVVVLLVIVVPLVVGYFVATSEPFFKKVILPRASKALNAKITVEHANIKPFSQVVLQGVKVQTTGNEPLATVQEARVRHSLMDILRGNIKVAEVTAVSPVIYVAECNRWSEQVKAQEEEKPQKPASKAPEKKPSAPPKLDIGQIRVENGTFRNTGVSQVTEVSNLNLTVANVRNGESGSVDISGRLLGDLEGALQGKLQFGLTPDLQPGSINGKVDLEVNKATAAMSELSGMSANMACEMTATEVKQLALTFQKQQQPLGQLRAYGPFSAAKQEGRLNVDLVGIDRRLLAIVGGRLGMDFADTKINSTNVVELAKAGNQLTASGALIVSGFSITQSNRSTPKVDLNLNYGTSVDRVSDAAVLQKFQLTGTQNQKPLITASLAQPMSIALGQTNVALPDSTLNAKITGFSFKDWAALLGDDVPEGNLNADMAVTSRESGKLLALKGNADVSGLMMNDPEKRKLMKPLEAKVRIDSSFRDKVVELTQLAVALTPTQLAKNEATLKGRIDMSRSNAITGKLELASDALDLNGYYDLLQGDEKKKPAAKPAAAPPTKPAVPAPQSAPAKKEFPFRDLVVDTKIGTVFLRELNLSNLVTGIRLDGSRVDVKPIAIALNGAPVSGTVSLDLGSEELGYDIALKMDHVPLAPIANSFAEDYRGRAKGDLDGNIQIKGSGTTGASLKQTLLGQLASSCTNGQIQLAGKNTRRLLDRIAGLLNLPELRTSTLTAFDSQIGFADGKIVINKLDLISEAFMAQTKGSIPIANVLTNSPIPKLPVTFALRRSYAEKAGLLPANTPPDAAYVPLPAFLYLTGTLGKPDTEQNEGVIIALLARSQVGRVGGEAGKTIQGALDTFLGGGKATNGAPSTNSPSTNKSVNPLDILRKARPK